MENGTHFPFPVPSSLFASLVFKTRAGPQAPAEDHRRVTEKLVSREQKTENGERNSFPISCSEFPVCQFGFRNPSRTPSASRGSSSGDRETGEQRTENREWRTELISDFLFRVPCLPVWFSKPEPDPKRQPRIIVG